MKVGSDGRQDGKNKTFGPVTVRSEYDNTAEYRRQIHYRKLQLALALVNKSKLVRSEVTQGAETSVLEGIRDHTSFLLDDGEREYYATEFLIRRLGSLIVQPLF